MPMLQDCIAITAILLAFVAGYLWGRSAAYKEMMPIIERYKMMAREKMNWIREQ